LAFDELFLMQLAAIKRRSQWQDKQKGIPFEVKTYEKQITAFIDSLPFTLTNAQQEAVEKIMHNMQNKTQMNRQLQGDVGSGKTVVAAIGMYVAFLNGYQSVLMAPTEILAQQHYSTVSRFLEPLGVTVDLVTGSKKRITKDSNFSILIGTHAVLSEKI